MFCFGAIDSRFNALSLCAAGGKPGAFPDDETCRYSLNPPVLPSSYRRVMPVDYLACILLFNLQQRFQYFY
ncbi:hypothetical protein DWG24_04880 [Dickeya zeae]|uniref:Uncharacterized protein n=1 Tax=Dickeya zeae TaxID=204042 RepID=A0AAE6YXD4_9GAMM|nr:hypothetical protein DWG24_04880 [Dickeya zeae]